MQSIHSFTLLIKFKTKLLRIKTRRQNVTFPRFWKSIKHPLGRSPRHPPPPSHPTPRSSIRKTEGKNPFFRPILTEDTKRPRCVCGNMPTPLSAEGFYLPPHPCQQELGPLFKGIDCPLLRPGEKRQMFPRLYQPVHYTVSFYKEEEKTPRGGKRPSPALNHRTMLHWSKSVCTCSAGLAERASPPQSARPTLNGCSAALAPFTGSSSLWLPGQIEVIQPSAGHKYNFNSVEGRKKLRTDQPGLPTINHRIRFDTLDSKAPSYWKVGP